MSSHYYISGDREWIGLRAWQTSLSVALTDSVATVVVG